MFIHGGKNPQTACARTVEWEPTIETSEVMVKSTAQVNLKHGRLSGRKQTPQIG